MAELGRVEFTIGDWQICVVADPDHVLGSDEKAHWLPGLISVARGAFGTEEIPESDVILHALHVDVGVYVLLAGQPIAFASCTHLDIDGIGVGYLEGTAVAPGFQRLGLYPLLTGLRLLSMSRPDNEFRYFSTRTQSPTVCKRLIGHEPYPFFGSADEARRMIAKSVAKICYTDLSDYRRPGGLSFDESTGVYHEAYSGSMYPVIPWSGDEHIDSAIAEHLRIERGDAFILVCEYGPDTARTFITTGLDALNASFEECRSVLAWVDTR